MLCGLRHDQRGQPVRAVLIEQEFNFSFGVFSLWMPLRKHYGAP
jgi:hypothetical protein